MHYGVYDWLMNSGDMVIYAFIKKFKSNNQKHVTSRLRQSDQKLYTSPTQHALQSSN